MEVLCRPEEGEWPYFSTGWPTVTMTESDQEVVAGPRMN